MPDNEKKPAPPYATFSSFINFFNKLRDTAIPSRIDPSVFGNASGSLIYSVIASLKSLKLISEEGEPSENFINFANADDDARKAIMSDIVTKGYPTLFNGTLDVSKATSGQLDEHIRTELNASGSTVDKVAAFFIAAAKLGEIELSPQIMTRKPIASSASSGKSKRQRKSSKSENGNLPPPPPPAPKMTEKALEYRLVDLLTEASGDQDVVDAIIKVVTFLKMKPMTDEKKAADQ